MVLYRGGAETPTYIFGGAFWPLYLDPSNNFGTQLLDGTQPIPTLSGSSGTAPMGLLDFGAGATSRYLVAFIFNLAPGQTWSMNEGFTPNAGPTTFLCYALDSNVSWRLLRLTEFITAAARSMMAAKLVSVLSARMAMRLNSLSLQKKFSIK